MKRLQSLALAIIIAIIGLHSTGTPASAAPAAKAASPHQAEANGALRMAGYCGPYGCGRRDYYHRRHDYYGDDYGYGRHRYRRALCGGYGRPCWRKRHHWRPPVKHYHYHRHYHKHRHYHGPYGQLGPDKRPGQGLCRGGACGTDPNCGPRCWIRRAHKGYCGHGCEYYRDRTGY